MHPSGRDTGVSGCACHSAAGPDPCAFLAATEVTALTIGPVQPEPVVIASDAQRQRLKWTCRSLGIVRSGSVAPILEASLQLIQAELQPPEGSVRACAGSGLLCVLCWDPSTLASTQQQSATEGCCRHRPEHVRNHDLESDESRLSADRSLHQPFTPIDRGSLGLELMTAMPCLGKRNGFLQALP